MAFAVIAVAGLAAVAGYAGLCWLSPFSVCARCDGGGERSSFLIGRTKPCRRCRGGGRRLRIGRRVYNAVHRRRRAAG